MYFDVRVPNSILDPLAQFQYKTLQISDLLRDILKQKHGIKLNILLGVIFYNKDKETSAYFITKAREITNEHDIDNVISNCNIELLNRISEWQSRGSGWSIHSIYLHELAVIKYAQLRGSSYTPLSDKLKNKKALNGVIWHPISCKRTFI